MPGHVDVQRGGLHLPVTFDDGAVTIDQEQVAGSDLGPVEPQRVDEVGLVVAGHRRREVVADPLRETEAVGEAERR